MNNKEVAKVGIADLKIVKSPKKIRTAGLGSCVGAVVYDEVEKVAALAHIMLPDSTQSRQSVFNPYKYADTAIEIMIEKLLANNAKKSRLKAKIAGGAQMFKLSNHSDFMRIGPRNVEAVQKLLNDNNIPIISSDTGGSCGRTIEFNPETSLLFVRTVTKGETYI